ncbi:base excision DNA repair protein [Xylaria flabelliformis]|nr:base excision DNA repair protein [Xylaria flabelliformis]
MRHSLRLFSYNNWYIYSRRVVNFNIAWRPRLPARISPVIPKLISVMAKANTKVVRKDPTNRRRSARHDATPPKIEIDDEQETKNESGMSESENGSEEKTLPKAKKTKRGLTDSLAPAAEIRRSKRVKSENDLKQHAQIKEEKGGKRNQKNDVKVEEVKADSDSGSPPIKIEAENNDNSNAHDLTEIPSPSKEAKATDLQAKKLKSYTQFAAARQSPYPDFPRPLPEECKLAHRILASLHGERKRPEAVKAPTSRAGCGDSASVLDALVRTILSQNTSDTNSSRAKRAMDAVYGGSDSWDAIVSGGQTKLAKTIESGGLAVVKSKVILSILEQTREKYGVYSLDHLFEASDEDAMREMLAFKGVGPKTASCVLLFCLRRPSFAVDTHVHRITGLLGWRPAAATRDQTHAHLDARIPDEDKYGLHVLIIRHGKDCAECRAGGKSLGKCELRKAFRKGKVEGEAGEVVKEDEEGKIKAEEKQEEEDDDDDEGDRKVKMEE